MKHTKFYYICIHFSFLDYGYGYEAPPAPVSAARGRGNVLYSLRGSQT